MIQTLLVRHSAMASRITQNTVFVALTVSSLATPSAATLSEPLPLPGTGRWLQTSAAGSGWYLLPLAGDGEMEGLQTGFLNKKN